MLTNLELRMIQILVDLLGAIFHSWSLSQKLPAANEENCFSFVDTISDNFLPAHLTRTQIYTGSRLRVRRCKRNLVISGCSLQTNILPPATVVAGRCFHQCRSVHGGGDLCLVQAPSGLSGHTVGYTSPPPRTDI